MIYLVKGNVTVRDYPDGTREFEDTRIVEAETELDATALVARYYDTKGSAYAISYHFHATETTPMLTEALVSDLERVRSEW